MRSMDPVANLTALADVWRDAASSSERVVSSFVAAGTDQGRTEGEPGPTGPSSRDLFVDFERSVDQMADAAKLFFGQLPFGGLGSPAEQPSATTIAVVDGVGTTEIGVTVGSPANEPWATDLVGHDGSRIVAENISIRQAQAFDQPHDPATRSYIIRVDSADRQKPGVYHGHILLKDIPDFARPLIVRVYDEE